MNQEDSISVKMRQIGSICTLVRPLSEEPEGRHDMALLMWDAASHIRRIAKGILHQLGPADIPTDLPDPSGDTAFGLFLSICRLAVDASTPRALAAQAILNATREVELSLEEELLDVTAPTAQASEEQFSGSEWEETELPQLWGEANILALRQHVEQELLLRLGREPDSPTVSVLQRLTALLCGQTGDLHGALQLLEVSLNTLNALHAQVHHPSVAAVHSTLGVICGRMGLWKKAKSYFEHCLATSRALHGERAHPALAATLAMLGTACEKVGDLAQAKQHLEESLGMSLELHGDQDHPCTAATLWMLARAHEEADMQEASGYLQASLKMCRALEREKGNPVLAANCCSLGHLFPDATHYLQSVQENCFLNMDPE